MCAYQNELLDFIAEDAKYLTKFVSYCALLAAGASQNVSCYYLDEHKKLHNIIMYALVPIYSYLTYSYKTLQHAHMRTHAHTCAHMHSSLDMRSVKPF